MPGVESGPLPRERAPRSLTCTAGQGYPEPSPYDTFMFDTKVRYVGDRVAAVAAETPEGAEAAVKAIKVEYEVLEPCSMDDAFAGGRSHDEPDATIPIPVPDEPLKNLVAHSAWKSAASIRVWPRPWPSSSDFRDPLRPTRHRALCLPGPDPLPGADRHRHEHAGAVPLPPHRGPVPRDSGAADPRDQAAHRGRVRRQAGGADRGRGRHC